MKLVAISDTHNRHNKIPAFKNENSLGEAVVPLGGDVIVHAGDATGRGEIWEIENFLIWLGKLNFTHKIFVPGNHDWGCETHPSLIEEFAKENGVILLNDSGIEIDGVKFWGSPVQPWFHNWAFNRERGEDIKRHWDLIPEGTNVLITHGPPMNVLDELVFVDGTPKGEFVGCQDLLEAVNRLKPDVHIFGHIHCGYGELHKDGTSFYNAAICDEMYYPTNPPHEIFIP